MDCSTDLKTDIMKRLFFIAAALMFFCSCSKEDGFVNADGITESVVYINLKSDGDTRASGTGHGVQADDNNIQTLEVFIFRVNEGGEDDGMLDGYRKFTGSELADLTHLEVKTTVGKKMIYAVANSHRENWAGIMTRREFEGQIADLYDEDVRNFTMIGGKEETLQLASSVPLSIKRLVARVQLNSVVAAFDGTPYQGYKLEDVKAYLTNVQGQKYIFDGSGENLKLLNQKKYVEADMAGSTMQGILYEQLASQIDDSGHLTPHYFYCYGNNRTEETETDRFTRLVIEGVLNGTTYYYPIAIKGLERNCCYSIDVKIQRPGSLDPDKDVELGTLTVNLEIEGWNALPGTTVDF